MSTTNSFRNCHIVSSVKYLPLSAVQKGLSTIGGVKRAAYILHHINIYLAGYSELSIQMHPERSG